MRDSEFLEWIIARLVKVYGESENVDFVQRLRKIQKRLEREENYVQPSIH